MIQHKNFVLSTCPLRTYCTPDTILGSGDYTKRFLEFISDGERQTIKKINSISDGDNVYWGKESIIKEWGIPGRTGRVAPAILCSVQGRLIR